MMSVTAVLFTIMLGVAAFAGATGDGHSGVVDGTGEVHLFSSLQSPGPQDTGEPSLAATHSEEGIVVSGVQGSPEETQLLRVHADEDEHQEPPQEKLLRVHEEQDDEEKQQSPEEPTQKLLRVHEEEETGEAEQAAQSFFQLASSAIRQQTQQQRLVRVHDEEEVEQPQEKSQPAQKKSRLARMV